VNISNNFSSLTLAKQFGEILVRKNMRCTVAESCTGGSLAAAITDIPGSSQWFDRGFVTYTNEAKHDMLSVPKEIIASFGAVSEQVVQAMAIGALAASNADISIAISGIAGPSGGSDDKPVGTVWIAWASKVQPVSARCFLFSGDRFAIRQQAVLAGLNGVILKSS
jgi:nicotinamide-nucleotide amidase